MADLDRVRVWADALIRLHLDPSWSFDFDNAKTRGGACHWGSKRITVSRYLAARWADDEVHQTLLHEVAHAMSGHQEGHGALWRRNAAAIGYVGDRTHSNEVANELAPWVGSCPRGHLFYRHRRPARALACGTCSRGFDHANVIEWRKREISAEQRRAARVDQP
ncbi:SprT-like domain-containing protein [Microbacteriaceae bacterium VKM Ac-2854]|nr:SprT-like domain-containing protein [Microbacteriaceae bacterium VKM Ac-2854]